MIQDLRNYFYLSQVSEKERVKFFLVQRYEDKVSLRLRHEAYSIYIAGKFNYMESMRQAMSRPNYLLKTIAKSDTWVGAYIPVRRPE